MFELARGFAADGMPAYVELQEREFALEDAGLHGDAAPARGRRRLLRPRGRDRERRRVLDARAPRLDRGRAVRVAPPPDGGGNRGSRGRRRGDPVAGGARPRRAAPPRAERRAGSRCSSAGTSGGRARAGARLDFVPSPRTAGRSRRRPPDLRDRRCEITGPPDRKMMINALNSGARVFMCDFEDACSPTWTNVVEGQAQPARRRPARHLARDAGEELHAERRGRDARRASARLAPRGAPRHRRRRAGLGVALRLRARVPPQRAASCSSGGAGRTSTSRSSRATWRPGCGRVRSRSPRRRSACPRGSIRCTVLIETIPAAFEMDAILYELRDVRLRAQRGPLGLHLLARSRSSARCCPTACR